MDSPTKGMEVGGPLEKVTEFDRDVIEDNVNDELNDNKMASS